MKKKFTKGNLRFQILKFYLENNNNSIKYESFSNLSEILDDYYANNESIFLNFFQIKNNNLNFSSKEEIEEDKKLPQKIIFNTGELSRIIKNYPLYFTVDRNNHILKLNNYSETTKELVNFFIKNNSNAYQIQEYCIETTNPENLANIIYTVFAQDIVGCTINKNQLTLRIKKTTNNKKLSDTDLCSILEEANKKEKESNNN